MIPTSDDTHALHLAKALLPTYLPIEHRVMSPLDLAELSSAKFWKDRYNELVDNLVRALSDYQHDMLQVARMPQLQHSDRHVLRGVELRQPLPQPDQKYRYEFQYSVKLAVDVALPFGKCPQDYLENELEPAIDGGWLESFKWTGAGRPDRVLDEEIRWELDDIDTEEM